VRRALTDGGPGTEFWQAFLAFKKSAWRWEHQPAYYIGYEHHQFDDFLAGCPQPPTENADLRSWMAQVKRQTHEGKTVGRVRVIDEPPTDYQRWMQWMDAWNTAAGEIIDYVTRRSALRHGLPATGGDDWWLFDDTRLVVMHHDEVGRRVRVELVVDEPEVEQARNWRALAIRAAQQEQADRGVSPSSGPGYQPFRAVTSKQQESDTALSALTGTSAADCVQLPAQQG
jgi:hypothetical protein